MTKKKDEPVKQINQEEINEALHKGDIHPLLNAMRHFVYLKGKAFLPRTIALDIIYGQDVNRGWFILEDEVGTGKENNPMVYHYENGIWKKDGSQLIRNILLMQFFDKCTRNMQFEVLNSITSDNRLFIKRETLNGHKNLINLKNGVYDYMKEELLISRMDYYFTTQFEIEYNKNAQCPRFLQFIDEVIKPEDVKFVQELFGYAFYSGYDIPLLCFFIGGGRNGKTTISQLLRALVGVKNTTSVSLTQLVDDPFASARLYEKYLMLSGDAGSKSIIDSSMIKRATGGDSINAADKYMKNFEFVNFAKFIIATNKPTRFLDKSEAMKERLKFVKFIKKFPLGDPKTDVHLLDKLVEEIPGIFNWAMVGLKRLMENNNFTYGKSTEESWEEYAKQADPIKYFFAEFFIMDDEGKVLKRDVQKQWREWSEKNDIIGREDMTDTMITLRLKKISDGEVKAKDLDIYHDDVRRPCYIGMSWKSDIARADDEITKQAKESPQKKLIIDTPLTDKIIAIKACVKWHKENLDENDLNAEGFDYAFIQKCIDQKILYIKPDGKVGVN